MRLNKKSREVTSPISGGMKILVVMKNWLGDLLFQMPALELIKQKYPEASITCVAPGRCREILEAHPAVSDFVPFDEKDTHRPLLARLGFAFRLRKLGPWDQAYIFHRSKSRALLLMLAGAKERIGFGKGRKWLLTRPLPEPSVPMHQLDYFFDLMQKAGFEVPSEKVSRFFYKDEDARQAADILKYEGIVLGTRYICFHLGANWEPKRWPPAHFSALAEKINERWHIPIVVTGSAQDRPLFEEFEKGVSHRFREKVPDPFIVDLVGKTSLRVSAAIFKHAACLVTGDSGPMHIASGVGAPVVALFGPTDPKLTGPRGIGENIVLQYVPEGYAVPFFGKELPEDGWLCKITPEQVLDAIDRILRKS